LAADILLVDDDDAVRFPIRRFLVAQGFGVRESASVPAALAEASQRVPDAAIIDYTLPGGTGLDLLRQLKEIQADVPVIVLTGHGTIDLAVQAMKEGAEQFFTKPVELATLLVVLQRALDNRRLRHVSRSRARAVTRVDPFRGGCPAIRRLAEHAGRVAPAAVPVLIQGETGSGKGVLARWMHDHGPRADEPFVDLNCAGLSRELVESELFGHEKGAFTGAATAKPGLLELADRGTLFLDEIGELDAAVQAKLLKVVEDMRFRRLGDVRDRRVDVRLVAATHRDLAALVAEGRFREDLLYRINTVSLVVPPLRERGADVVALARDLLRAVASDLGRSELSLSPDAEALVAGHPWPGNVRQLRNALERAALLADRPTLEPHDLGGAPLGGAEAPAATRPPERLTLAEVERRHIESVLRTEGSVPAAAAVLGLSRSALYERLKKHDIAVRRA
jgi:DNA-binding NtrC family response regulator